MKPFDRASMSTRKKTPKNNGRLFFHTIKFREGLRDDPIRYYSNRPVRVHAKSCYYHGKPTGKERYVKQWHLPEIEEET